MAASLRLFRILFRLALPMGWAWFIFWVSSTPVPPGAGTDGGFLSFLPRADLFAHFGVYAIFGWLVMQSLLPIKLCKPINVSLHFAMPVIIAGVSGIAMEWVQDGIPERSAEAVDVVADIAGAIAAVAFMAYLWPKIKRLGHAIAA
ncbi:MAG: VanZ family protein [Chloroflexi bacterium]|nr:VanZ family protein [Chloroflexota bacterium]